MAAVLVLTYRGWRDHRVVRLGAGLAYYGLFALVPLVTAMVLVADLLVTFEAAVAFVAAPLADLLGEDVDVVAASISERAADLQTTGSLGIVGIVAVLLLGFLASPWNLISAAFGLALIFGAILLAATSSSEGSTQRTVGVPPDERS